MNKFQFVRDGRNIWHCCLNGTEYKELCIIRYNHEEAVGEFNNLEIVQKLFPAVKEAVEKSGKYVYEIPNCVNPVYFGTLKEAKAFIKNEYGNSSIDVLEYYREEV